MMKNASLLKIGILLQFVGEILALLCLDDSIQILLILSLPVLNVWNWEGREKESKANKFKGMCKAKLDFPEWEKKKHPFLKGA